MMSYHSELDAEQAVEFYDPDRYMCQDDYEYFMRQGEYEMTQDATRKELNDYNSKPVEVSNDTPAGRATNRILDGANVKGMQPDEVRDIIEDACKQAKLEGIRLGLSAAADLVGIYPCSGISNDLFRHGREFGLAFVEEQIQKRGTGISESIIKLDPATILAESEKKS